MVPGMGIIMKLIPVAVALFVATSSIAAELDLPLTATKAQWRDIRTLTELFVACGGSSRDNVRECAQSHRMQAKMVKQGFCFFKRLHVGKLAWHGPEKDRRQGWPEGVKQCYEIHDPARDY
jgi:hypothetical protein